jgi:hypothetical protein
LENQSRIGDEVGSDYLKAYTNPDDYTFIEEDYLGKMDQVCQHCNSFNFQDEKTSDGGLLHAAAKEKYNYLCFRILLLK